MKVLCSRKRAFFIDTLKRSPEIDSHLRMFCCHSSSAISYAVSSEGKVFALKDCAHETLCSRRCVWRVSDHCQCWSSHVHHQDVEEFLGSCHPVNCESGSDRHNAHVAAMLTSGLVAGFSAPVNSAGTSTDRRDT